MQAEQLRGVADAAIRSLERSRDEDLLEFAARVVVAYTTVQHHSHEALELIAHVPGY